MYIRDNDKLPIIATDISGRIACLRLHKYLKHKCGETKQTLTSSLQAVHHHQTYHHHLEDQSIRQHSRAAVNMMMMLLLLLQRRLRRRLLLLLAVRVASSTELLCWQIKQHQIEVFQH